ncbi:MAG: 23S rRNA (adenine(2503)-C(2))-methyltransferase RlmN [Patescibacteria group bacterium]|nr:23S rRNA (adenine(2503)-C(2))-methyltransferase RlmN [Patescibacteria group bacterium]
MKNLDTILSDQPAYRRDQIYRAWFDPAITGFTTVTTLPKDLRQELAEIPWQAVAPLVIEESKIDDTKKALLRLADGLAVETVLLGRASKKQTKAGTNRFTICVSSQVGCAMKCVFCATGRLGFKRNLTAEEIVGQYRFWQKYLTEQGAGRVDNIVFMGQGEPLLNYDEVKKAINLILKYTDVGPTKITISTGGVIAGMEKMVADKDFPAVRFALSLHSAIEGERKKIIPSQPPKFFEFMTDWAKKYHARFGNRTHFLGLEYLFLAGINDDAKHFKALADFASRLGRVRINLIPYNATDKKWTSASETLIKNWRDRLLAKGFIATMRVSQGADISAACGQLANKSVVTRLSS